MPGYDFKKHQLKLSLEKKNTNHMPCLLLYSSFIHSLNSHKLTGTTGYLYEKNSFVTLYHTQNESQVLIKKL